MNVTLYVHGMISFGAIVGGMIATSGDEAFVMLAEFPGTAMALFGLLFVSGILFAWVTDKLIGIFHIVPCESCSKTVCELCLSGTNKTEEGNGIFSIRNISKNFHPLSFTRFLLLLDFRLLFDTAAPWDNRHNRLELETHYFCNPIRLFLICYDDCL